MVWEPKALFVKVPIFKVYIYSLGPNIKCGGRGGLESLGSLKSHVRILRSFRNRLKVRVGVDVSMLPIPKNALLTPKIYLYYLSKQT